MTIETIEQQLSATRDTLAALEAELAALKKPAVRYRPAEWPRDFGRNDAEFGNGEGCRWSGPWMLIGFNPTASNFFGGWLANQAGSVVPSAACRVPIRDGDEYREPVLPGDHGKPCEFSQDGVSWVKSELVAYFKTADCDKTPWRAEDQYYYAHARIRTGAAE